jgi:AcrR family transcriptional regulator
MTLTFAQGLGHVNQNARNAASLLRENLIVPHDLRVITYDAIVAGARRHFLREATIDMEQLAQELAVSRATLYRAVDGRDRLLGDVLWSLAERTYAHARRDLTLSGVDAILEISHRFTDAVMTSPPFRGFLEQEPQTALRVLLTPAGGVHERSVALQREIFSEAFAGREHELPGDIDSLAYLYVRLRESILYADIMSGRQPDPDVAERAVRALLTAG